MNTVGPYHNRQETYSYFSLPFCAGPKEVIAHYHETLGEALQGFELEFSGLSIEYKCNLLTFLIIYVYKRITRDTFTKSFVLSCLCRITAETPHSVYCEIELNEEKYKAFSYAIKNRYWYQMFVDDLPIWGEYFKIGG
jgi:transmembrane 9 superfamily protein 3